MKSLLIFLSVAMFTRYYIRFAKRKNLGQLIKKDGPDLHGYKEGTPTMGGIVFIPLAAMGMIWCGGDLFVVITTLSFFAVGLIDDLVGILKRDAYGMSARVKFSLQLIIALTLIAVFGVPDSVVKVPFSEATLDLGWFYPVLAVFLLVGVPNAVNLTDGLDGLAGWVFLSGVVPMYAVKADHSLLIISSAVLAFLLYNSKPASVFMGDAGAMGLGGFMASFAITNDLDLFLVFFGFIFLIETLSVIVQVMFYKRTGKRIFKMSPLHHHFELSGWSEEKIVFVFSAINLVMSLSVL